MFTPRGSAPSWMTLKMPSMMGQSTFSFLASFAAALQNMTDLFRVHDNKCQIDDQQTDQVIVNLLSRASLHEHPARTDVRASSKHPDPQGWIF